MRPAKLTIQAIGPFAEQTVVDFSRLANGLFLIAGPTGSGKSTLFDAIVFALYGRTSAETRRVDGASIVSDFAGDTAEPFVELQFHHQGSDYVVRRRPSYRRQKKRGSGLTDVPAEATLWRGGDVIAEQVRQVDDAIVALLGVDATQFRQLYMLPQGEFARILNASSSDRQAIFRTVFGTAYIDRFKDELQQRMNEARRALNALDDALLNASGQLPPDDRLEKAAGLNEAAAARDIHAFLLRLPGLKDDLAALEKDMEALDERDKKAALADQAAERELRRAERDDEVFADFEKAKAEREALRADEPVFLARERRWRAAKRAREDVRPAWEQLRDAASRKRRNDSDLASLSRQKDEAGQRAEAAELLETKLLAARPDEAADREKLAALKEEIAAFSQLAAIDRKLAGLKQALAADEAAVEAKAKQAAERTTRLTELRARQDGLAEAVLLVSTLKNELETLKRAAAETASLAEALSSRDELAAALQAANAGRHEAAARHNRLEQAFFDGQAGELARTLVDGEPCPVCGSTDHPEKALPAAAGVSRDDVAAAAKDVETARAGCESLTKRLASLDSKNEEKLSAILQQLGRDTITAACGPGFSTEALAASIGERRKTLEPAFREADAQKSRLERERLAIAALEKEEAESRPVIEDLTARIGRTRLEISSLEGQRTAPLGLIRHETAAEAAAAYAELDAILKTFADDKKAAAEAKAQSLKAWTALSARLEEAGKQAESIRLECAEKDSRFRAALTAGGFDEEADFLAASLDDDSFQTLEASVAAGRKKREASEIEWTRTSALVEGRTRPDLDAVREAREQARSERASCQREASTFRARLENWQQAGAALARLAGERGRQQDLAEAMTALYQVAAGQLAGAEKRTFESYLQMTWFSEVVWQANLRLDVMSEKRFQLVARSDGRSQGSKSGLDLDVFDAYTGKERAADTLSGGETFMASLALALGLSDVVSARAGGREVDCLFVDEGFGSLDDTALGQAVQTLANLSGDHRLIGIISHVGELKRAIARQLLVEKRPEGSRVVWRGL